MSARIIFHYKRVKKWIFLAPLLLAATHFRLRDHVCHIFSSLSSNHGRLGYHQVKAQGYVRIQTRQEGVCAANQRAMLLDRLRSLVAAFRHNRRTAHLKLLHIPLINSITTADLAFILVLPYTPFSLPPFPRPSLSSPTLQAKSRLKLPLTRAKKSPTKPSMPGPKRQTWELYVDFLLLFFVSTALPHACLHSRFSSLSSGQGGKGQDGCR